MHYRRMEPQPREPDPWHDYRYVQDNYDRPHDMPHAGAVFIDGDWYWRLALTETVRT